MFGFGSFRHAEDFRFVIAVCVLGAEYHLYNVHFISNWIQVNKEDWYSYLLPHDSSEGEHGHIHGD